MESFNLNSKIICETAVALGFFDGLHKGHQAIIKKAVETENIKSAVFTFNQSPLLNLNGQAPDKIITNKQKHEIFDKLGLDIFLSVDFKDVMNLTAEDFVKEILIEKLHAKYVYCGFNFTFGKGGIAKADDLRNLCSKYNITAEIIKPVFQEGNIISSTVIRGLLKYGNIEAANEMLGRPYSIKSDVVHGRKIGRLMETPTINQMFTDNLIKPKFGVYASLVWFDNVFTYGVTNIGIKPTVGSELPLAETFMPKYNGEDIYGKEVEVALVKFIRPEIKFDNMEDLKQQILFDADASKKIFENKKYS